MAEPHVSLRREPRVMVVEDEPRMREALLDELPGMGYHATGFRAAEAALRAQAEDPCDIVMLDLNLPVMDGMEFLERFRQTWPDTPVIILTGFGSLDSARRAIDYGVTAFLTKPCHLGEIEQALGKARRTLEQASPGRRFMAGEAVDGEEPPEAAGSDSEAPTLAELERQAILAALQRNGGNRSAAAAELGISRRTLYNRLDQYASEDDVDPT